MTISNRLKEARLKMPEPNKQKDFANILGLEQATVSRWERGTAEPNRKMVEKISELSGLKPEYIMFGVVNRDQVLRESSFSLNKTHLSNAIKALETALEARQQSISPDKKAELISLIYDTLIESKQNADTNANHIEKMLTLI